MNTYRLSPTRNAALDLCLSMRKYLIEYVDSVWACQKPCNTVFLAPPHFEQHATGYIRASAISHHAVKQKQRETDLVGNNTPYTVHKRAIFTRDRRPPLVLGITYIVWLHLLAAECIAWYPPSYRLFRQPDDGAIRNGLGPIY